MDSNADVECGFGGVIPVFMTAQVTAMPRSKRGQGAIESTAESSVNSGVGSGS
jgi:hypothetical protein